MKLTLRYKGASKPLEFTVPFKWKAKPISAIVDFFCEWHNEKVGKEVSMNLVTQRGLTMADAWDFVEKNVPSLTSDKLIVLKGGEAGPPIAQTAIIAEHLDKRETLFFKEYVWDDDGFKTKKAKEKDALKDAEKAEAFREKVAEKVQQQGEEGSNEELLEDGAIGGGYYYAHKQRGDEADAAAAPEHRPLDEREVEQVQIAATGGEGEGMSRWNTGYHWEERNLDSWAAERLQQLFTHDDRFVQVNRKILPEGSDMWLELDEVTVEGHASSSLRKGQTIICYELTIKIQWKGMLEDDTGQLSCVKGRADIPMLTEDVAVKATPVFVRDESIDVHGAEGKEEEGIDAEAVAPPKLAVDNTPFVPLPPEKQRTLLTQVMRTKGFRKIIQVLEKFIGEIKEY